MFLFNYAWHCSNFIYLGGSLTKW